MTRLTRTLITVAALAIATAGQGQPARRPAADPMVDVKANDAAMEAAKARGRAGLSAFLNRLRAPPPGTGNYQIKYDLVPGTGAEFIWASGLSFDGRRLTGRLANNPAAAGFRIGQPVTIPLADVIDWGYVENGTMIGHFTTRALLSHMEPREAAEIRAALGWK